MPVIVRDIVNAVINDLSQVPGVATQIYSAGRIQQFIQDAFLLEFEDFWWPDYMTYAQSGVDGTTGHLTADLVGPLGSITEYRDIHSAWPVGRNKKLREIQQSVNPTTLLAGSGAKALYMAPDYTAAARPLRIYPPTATQDIVVWARQRPELPLDIDETLYLDQLLLQYDACWMYAVDDGTVPAQVNKFQVLAQNRRTKLHASFSQQPIELDPRVLPADATMETFNNDWFTLDADPLA